MRFAAILRIFQWIFAGFFSQIFLTNSLQFLLRFAAGFANSKLILHFLWLVLRSA